MLQCSNARTGSVPLILFRTESEDTNKCEKEAYNLIMTGCVVATSVKRMCHVYQVKSDMKEKQNLPSQTEANLVPLKRISGHISQLHLFIVERAVVVHYCADAACGIVYTFPVIKISSSCFGLSLSARRFLCLQTHLKPSFSTCAPASQVISLFLIVSFVSSSSSTHTRTHTCAIIVSVTARWSSGPVPSCSRQN